MIYDATPDKGTTIGQAAREAIKTNCDQFLFNGTIYSVKIDYQETHRVVSIRKPDPITNPVDRYKEFSGECK